MNPYRTELEVGDWSNDGHNQSETYIVESNATHDIIRKAFLEGSEKLGFNLVDDCCHDYEDSNLAADKIQILLDAGLMELWKDNQTEWEEGKLYAAKTHVSDDLFIDEFGSQEWALLYMKIAQYGRQWLEFKFVQAPTIHIGGYGLFYC